MGTIPIPFPYTLHDPLGRTASHYWHTMGAEKYPEVQGGGSLILAWQVRNKKVLIIGGGEPR